TCWPKTCRNSGNDLLLTPALLGPYIIPASVGVPPSGGLLSSPPSGGTPTAERYGLMSWRKAGWYFDDSRRSNCARPPHEYLGPLHRSGPRKLCRQRQGGRRRHRDADGRDLHSWAGPVPDRCLVLCRVTR